MKVLFLHAGIDSYGASRSLLRLTTGLRADGHEVLVLLPCVGPLNQMLADSGVAVRLHPRMPILSRHRLKRPWDPIRLLIDLVVSVAQLRIIIRTYRPDVVHTNAGVLLSGGMAARLVGVPHVWHFRESFGEFPGWLWKTYRQYVRLFATRVLCVSRAVADQFGRWQGHGRVVVLHNGIASAESENVDPDAVATFRRAWGLDGWPVVGVVGRIKCPAKGQDVFVRAAALLKDQCPDARFLIVGTPFPGNESHQERVEELIRELDLEDRVILTGDVDDAYPVFCALDVAVLPSVHPEGFPGAVVEAMAVGRPVIGTNVGGTREQIEDGTTGLLIPPGSPEALADAIRRLLADPPLRASMGCKGRERYLALFEYSSFYDRMLGIYRDVMGGGKAAG